MYSRLVYIPLILILFSLPSIADPVIIPPGGEVYLGEEGLNVQYAVPYPYTSIAYFPAGSSPGRDQPLDIIPVYQGSFNVIPDLFSGRTGAWYQWDQVHGIPGHVAFIVRNPRISLRVMDRNTMGDLSFGTVPRGTPLIIQVETNLAGITRRPGFSYGDEPVKIVIRTPGGGTLSGVMTPGGGEYLFSSFLPTGEIGYAPPIETGGWDTGWGGYESGQYRIEPQFGVNRMEDNLRTYPGVYTLRETGITLGNERAGLSLSSETVVRGDPFAVTISGTPGSPYVLWIEGGSTSGLPGEQPPMILTSQEGIRQDYPGGPYVIGSYRPQGKNYRVHEIVPSAPYGGVYYYAEVIPDKNGKRTVELRTSQETDDRSYSIHVEGPVNSANPKSDEIEVRVVKGSVSLTTGDDTVTIGEEIILHGVNTGSCETYLFITGPNLPPAGGRLDAPQREVIQGNTGSFTIADGDCETWEYRLYTGNLGLDTGTYTIYAVSSPSDRYHLGSTSWQAIPITLKKPYIAVTNRKMAVAKGDELTITGTSGGSPDAGVAIWIFGRNYLWYDTVPTERGGWFSYDLSGAVTSGMAPGEYAVIIQHPMANGAFDIWPDGNHEMVLGTTPWYGAPLFRIAGPGALQGPAAASALITALSSQFIDDTYTEYSIFVETPKIIISSESLNGTVNNPIIISGTTNLAPGSDILVEISNQQFAPTPKGDTGGWTGYSGTASIRPGREGEQEFTFEIPSGIIPAGTYQVLITGVSSPGTASGILTVALPIVPTPTPAQTLITPGPTQINITSPTTITPEKTVIDTPVPAMVTEAPTSSQIPERSQGEDWMQSVRERSQESPVLLGLGVIIGLLIAGLVIVTLAWYQKRKDQDSVISAEENESLDTDEEIKPDEEGDAETHE